MAEREQNRIVFDLKLISNIRLICGYYYDLHSSRTIRGFAKFYCISFATIIIIFNILWLPRQQFVNSFVIFEYLLYVLISWKTKSNYIIDFYNYIPLVDGLAGPRLYLRLNNLLNGLFIILFTVKFVTLGMICYIISSICLESLPVLIPDTLIWAAATVGASSLVMVMSLLYCRVKIILKTLKINGFDNTPESRFYPSRYMQMYEMVVDSFEKTVPIIKQQLVVYSMSWLWTFNYKLFFTVESIKEYGYDFLQTAWFLVNTVHPFLSLIMGAVLADLITIDIREIEVVIFDKKLECTKERDRSKIEKLLQFIKSEPLDCRLFRVFPLSLRTLLVCMSFCLTTVIAILQIKFAI